MVTFIIVILCGIGGHALILRHQINDLLRDGGEDVD